jgi:hypothetical protein
VEPWQGAFRHSWQEEGCVCHCSFTILGFAAHKLFSFFAEAKQKKEDEAEEVDEDEDDKEYKEGDEDEEDILEYSYDDSEEEEEEEEEEEDNLEEDEMPPKTKAKAKTPPRKKTPSKTPPRKKTPSKPTVKEVTEDLGAMDVTDDKPYAKEINLPQLKYKFSEDRKKMNVELWVSLLPNSYYRVKLSPDQRHLHISFLIPGCFHDKNRQTQAFAEEDDFNDKVHQNTAYQDVIKAIIQDHDTNDEQTEEDVKVYTEPLIIPLDEKYEEEVDWEVQTFCVYDQHDPTVAELMDALGSRIFVGIMTCKLTNVEKPKQRIQGHVRVVGMPPPMDQQIEEETG